MCNNNKTGCFSLPWRNFTFIKGFLKLPEQELGKMEQGRGGREIPAEWGNWGGWGRMGQVRRVGEDKSYTGWMASHQKIRDRRLQGKCES